MEERIKEKEDEDEEAIERKAQEIVGDEDEGSENTDKDAKEDIEESQRAQKILAAATLMNTKERFKK